MSHYRLFLDDERLPKHVTWTEIPLGPWTIVRDYHQFVATITKLGMPDHISFDHDLAAEHYAALLGRGVAIDASFKHKTGYDCAKWLVEHCTETGLPVPAYTVHSMNPIGKDNIVGLLEGFKRSRSE